MLVNISVEVIYFFLYSVINFVSKYEVYNKCKKCKDVMWCSLVIFVSQVFDRKRYYSAPNDQR